MSFWPEPDYDWLYVGIWPGARGLTPAEWRWMNAHSFLSLEWRSPPRVAESCVWWNEV